MLVRQRILHRLNQRLVRQDLIRHLIHDILHTGAIILRKDPQRDIPRRLPRIIEHVDLTTHLVQIPEPLPLPVRRDIGTQHAVPGFRKRGVLVAQEAPELRIRALQDRQAADARVDGDAPVFFTAVGHVCLHGAGLFAVLDERVRVGFASDIHARPAMCDNVGLSGVDVVVGLDEMRSQDRGEELGGRDRVLFGKDVDGVFDGVRGHDGAIVCLCIPVQL